MAGDTDEVLLELRSLKKLMILDLLRQGVKQSQIAAVLGISEPTMSRMLPKGIGKSASKRGIASTNGETS